MTHSDDRAAPGYVPGAANLPWYRRAFAQGAGYTLPSVIFVVLPVVFAWGQPAVSVALVAAICLAILVLVLGTSLIMHWPEWARWLWLAGLVAAVASLGLFPNARPLYFAPFIAIAAATLIAWRRSIPALIGGTVVGLILALIGGDLFAVIMVLMGLSLALSIGQGIRVDAAKEALRAAEERTAVLAVAAERERIGRDLHDILGHSLTAIVVKADLAERLIVRDPQAAAGQVRELAGVARQALKDVRSTARGMQQVRLAGEIASARSVLGAAGFEARVPAALPLLSDADSELLGYAVREAVTNVIRHSGGSVCTIEADRGGIRVSDDGNGINDPGTGSGLDGLRTRVAAAGGALTVTSGGFGTELVVRLAQQPVTAAEAAR